MWNAVYVPLQHFKPNKHRRRRRDKTVESRRIGGVYMNSQLAHDDCQRIRSTIWKLAKQTVSVSVSWLLNFKTDVALTANDAPTSAMNDADQAYLGQSAL